VDVRPARDEFATAIRGRGAVLDGVPLRSGSPEPGRDLDIATSHPDYTTDEQKRALLGLRVEGVVPRPCGSAGLEYLAVARGELDATAFSWEAAWDHAAGLLLVEEAGGAHLTLTGEPFRVTGGNALPFTTARDEATARRVVALLTARPEQIPAGA
jgi:fructose-1,6-bisphosphatase/inositol monophosphatase family enzyme